ncbi:MAG: hypothetical protein A3K66_04840 [Euryarchaeota archaeon RBG_16_67_27]|nr:MAG: hypothetical protein A3K66_04840 [Euryarchaeota archaeon RBG_16_67_27]
MATIAASSGLADPVRARVGTFLWLSSGMFGVAALTLAASGYVGLGSLQHAGTNFVAGLVAAGLFGLVSLLKFGPSSA